MIRRERHKEKNKEKRYKNSFLIQLLDIHIILALTLILLFLSY